MAAWLRPRGARKGRALGLSGRLLLTLFLDLAAAAAGSAAAARATPSIVAVLAAGLACGGVAAVLLERVLWRDVKRSLRALEDGVRSFRDGDFSLRLAEVRRDEVGGLVALYNEMADALRSERNEIHQRELLLDAMLQGAPMAVFLLDGRRRVRYANRAARDLGDGGRVVGRPFEEISASAPAGFQDALAAGGDALFTVGPPGSEETYRLLQREFDLNAQRHTLLTLERLTSDLNRQEVEVWKKAIRVMNHELNNSLAPVSSLVHSARHVLGAPAHGHRLGGILESIDERVRHLTAFLEGYARFARLPRPSRTRVPWRVFLESVGRLCPFRIEGGLPASGGFFDATQMEQVLINLLKNAHESGGPPEEVAVSVAATAEGGAVVRVLDRGPGMSEEVLRQALLPFTSSKPAGSGLGLPLCREILEAHGGRFLIQNREGGGLVVSCWLPPGMNGR